MGSDKTEKHKQWRRKNRAAFNAHRRKHYAANKARILAKAKEYKPRVAAWVKEDRRKDPLKHTLRQAKMRAKELGIEFSLQREHVVLPEFCPVLGIRLTVGAGQSWRHVSSPSLDRFDNTKGYVPGNVRVISWRANRLKADATIEEVRAILEYMEGRR